MTASVFIAFQPVYYISKFTGTLPLSIEQNGQLKYLHTSSVYIISILLLVYAEICNLFFLHFQGVDFFKSNTIEAGYIVHFTGDILLNITFISIVYFVVFEAKNVPMLFQTFYKLENIIPLKNCKMIRRIFEINILLFHVFSVILNLAYLKERKIWAMFSGLITEIALTSLELQIFSIIYLTKSFFNELNDKLESSIANGKFIPGIKFIQLRNAYVELVETSAQINSIYNINLLFILCLRNTFIQFDIYLEFQVIYDSFYGYGDGDWTSGITWALLDGVKLFYIFFICIEAVKEVS